MHGPPPGVWGNRVSPYPCARAAPSQPPAGGVWANPVPPDPCLRASPSHPLPRVGKWGNPVSPCPCVRTRPSRRLGRGETRFPHTPAPAAYVHLSRPCGSAAPRRDDHRFFLGGLRPPRPSCGRGRGETRFPHPPAHGLRVLAVTLPALTRNQVSGAGCPGPRLAPCILTLHRGRCAPVPPGVADGVADGVACDGRAGTIALRFHRSG